MWRSYKFLDLAKNKIKLVDNSVPLNLKKSNYALIFVIQKIQKFMKIILNSDKLKNQKILILLHKNSIKKNEKICKEQKVKKRFHKKIL